MSETPLECIVRKLREDGMHVTVVDGGFHAVAPHCKTVTIDGKFVTIHNHPESEPCNYERS
jgi:hypothetical protein